MKNIFSMFLLCVTLLFSSTVAQASGTISSTQSPTVRDGIQQLGTTQIVVDAGSLRQGDIVVVRLPQFASFGTSFDTDVQSAFRNQTNQLVILPTFNGRDNWNGESDLFEVRQLDDQRIIITSLIDQKLDQELAFYIQFGNINIDSGSYGAVNVTFEPSPGSGFPAGTTTIGKVFGERTTFELSASAFQQIEDTMTFNLQIDEDHAGALKQGKLLRVRLPQGFIWDDLDKAKTINHDAGDLRVRQNHSREITIERLNGSTSRASKWDVPLQFKVDDSSTLDSREIELEFQWDQRHRLTIGSYEKPIIKEYTVFEIGSLTYMNNDVAQSIDVAPYIKEGRAYLPVRFVAEAIGVEDEHIVWNQSAQTVNMTVDGKSIRVKVGSHILILDGKEIEMDVAPEIKDGRVMLPIRYISEAFDKPIEWDEKERTVTIEK